MYVIATKQQDVRMQANAVTKLVEGAEEWGNLLKIDDAGVLMNQHVALAKQLTDAAFAQDKGSVDATVEALILNANNQVRLYESYIPGFPKDEFEKLFMTHVTATGGYILALAAGDVPDFQKNWRMVVDDRNKLARFWGRLCLILRR